MEKKNIDTTIASFTGGGLQAVAGGKAERKIKNLPNQRIGVKRELGRPESIASLLEIKPPPEKSKKNGGGGRPCNGSWGSNLKRKDLPETSRGKKNRRSEADRICSLIKDAGGEGLGLESRDP